MQVESKKSSINKDFFPTSKGAFAPLIVVYKIDSNLWKGFVDPYGETTEADSKKKAVEKMRLLTSAYKRTVEEYKNPKHLVYAGLGDIRDREVFSKIVSDKNLMNAVHADGKAEGESYYVETHRD